jgi:hypothetical protein
MALVLRPGFSCVNVRKQWHIFPNINNIRRVSNTSQDSSPHNVLRKRLQQRTSCKFDAHFWGSQTLSITQSVLAISIYIFYTLHTYHPIKHQINWFYRTTLTPRNYNIHFKDLLQITHIFCPECKKNTSFMDETNTDKCGPSMVRHSILTHHCFHMDWFAITLTWHVVSYVWMTVWLTRSSRN